MSLLSVNEIALGLHRGVWLKANVVCIHIWKLHRLPEYGLMLCLQMLC